ncbi:MAG TPA: ABC transporter ATP-binding protein [Nocardioidaceae bacterium]|nr:ABC transporter ATP-binding protein [Nocardioidaceae bacterium]
MPTKPELLDRAGADQAIVDLRDLSVHYDLGGSTLARLVGLSTGTVRAVDGVNLTIRPGEVVGLVGESGSGKSTLGRALLGLAPITGGSIILHGRDLGRLSRRGLRRVRSDVQMVFQDPNGALNPAMIVEEAVADPLRIHGVGPASERHRRVVETLELVGLSPVELFASKYPSDLSGGQKQRVVIARAIIMGPSVLVADEPISMLDMSVRAKILQLMLDLKDRLDLTYLYITHDLASAKFFCDRIAIMYLGRIVELGSTADIFADPKHPYTKALLAAIPDPDPSQARTKQLLSGEIPDAARPPGGCAFHPRCPAAFDRCGWEARDLAAGLESHWLRNRASTYDTERAKISNLDAIARQEAGRPALLRPSGTGSPADLTELLTEMRDEAPDARFWTGVESVEERSGGVEVTFHPGEEPLLRPSGRVEVACHLFPPESEAAGRHTSPDPGKQ